jgi:hypothetical protein
VGVSLQEERDLVTTSASSDQKGDVPTPPLPKPPLGWSRKDWEDFLTVAGPIGKYLVEAWKWKTERENEQSEKWDRRVQWTLVLLMGFLGGIVLLMSWLVVSGKVSGDALLFLVGAVASWILFATQRYLFGENQDGEERPLI